MFFPRQAETLNRADRSEVMSLKRFPVDGLNLFQHFEIANRHIDKNTDLALLQVHGEDIEKRTTVQFFVLNHESVTPPPGTPVVSFGYPSEIAKQIEGGNFIAFTSVDWSEAVEHQDLPGCDQSIHFLKQYGLAEVEPAAHPRGFSGAGVWYRQGATPVGKIWTPRPQLAGVITHYYQ